ncbi:hypothetical protein BGC33_08095, partial [Bathymodiolus thermophilus thioautotrophic gill symbiont]
MGEKWIIDDYSYLCKGLYTIYLLISLLYTHNKKSNNTTPLISFIFENGINKVRSFIYLVGRPT